MLLGTQDKDFFPVNMVEKLKFIKEIGFDAFEIDGKILLENLEEVKRAIKESGIPIVSACGGYRGWIGDFIEERRVNAIEDLTHIIKAIAEVGGTGVVVPAAWGMFTFRLPPMVSPRSAEGDRKAIIDSLTLLDQVAKENGVYIYLEPLNRYQDHMLNTLKEAKDIIEKGKFDRVRITADFYHMNIEEDDISDSLIKYQDNVGHIHIAENHRYQPGTGCIDFKRHLKTLKEIGYNGAIVYEGRVRGENLLDDYKQSVKYIRQYI